MEGRNRKVGYVVSVCEAFGILELSAFNTPDH